MRLRAPRAAVVAEAGNALLASDDVERRLRSLAAGLALGAGQEGRDEMVAGFHEAPSVTFPIASTVTRYDSPQMPQT